MNSRKRRLWSDVKARLKELDRAGLVALIRDLYRGDPKNRRFLHARYTNDSSVLDEYRRLVVEAVYPHPLKDRPIRLRDANRIITEYKSATGDLSGAVDLMLEFVEAGSEQAANLGFGDEAYFGSMVRKVEEVLGCLDFLPVSEQAAAAARLSRLRGYRMIGWGYGDYLVEVSDEVEPYLRRHG